MPFILAINVPTEQNHYAYDEQQYLKIRITPFIYIPRISLIYLALQLFLNNVGFSLA